MTTFLFTHAACVLHENGPDHPESPERLKAIFDELAQPEYAALLHREAPPATVDQIARVHDRDYVEDLLARVPSQGYAMAGREAMLSPHSGEAALRAAGAVIAAVDAVLGGKAIHAFCAVRPPGHHSERATAMGFCYFNNIAIGAAHALAVHRLERVALVDFDVHHGNGTQEWAIEEPRAFFLSSHQFPCYPGTGRAQEKGAHGNILNLPLVPGAGSVQFRSAMENFGLPALDKFQPQLILISAGFDAHRDDPLANLDFETEDYAWITREICKLARRHCQGRIVSTLEGGYDLEALAASVGAHVRELMA
jgi:acetoin utilization deacetylase AcuC-like enzyme